jgi:hypothetical protein
MLKIPRRKFHLGNKDGLIDDEQSKEMDNDLPNLEYA